MRLRSPFIALVTAGVILLGCTSSKSGTATTDDASASAAPPEELTGPAPGVTDTAIKVGVLFPDLKAIAEVASLDHGDLAKAYQIAFDDLNAKGGINGRKLEAIIAGVKPIGTEPAEAACAKLTQDDKVFIIVGFLQGDDVLCPLETHETAVLGGSMTPERLSRAKAPWFTNQAGSDLATDVIRAMAKGGTFTGTLALFGGPAEEKQVRDVIAPLLKELGVNVKDTALLEQQGDQLDITQSNAQVQVVAERFKSEGVTQVLAIGSSGLAWASGIENTNYRPQLLLTDPSSTSAYAGDAAGRDLSVLDKAVAGNLFGGAENIWKEPKMQECIKIMEAGGLPVPEPDTIPQGQGKVFIAGTTACADVALLTALLEAPGKNLNYVSLAAAVKDLKVSIPGQPDPLTYGPPPAADGDATAFLYDWDATKKDFVIRMS